MLLRMLKKIEELTGAVDIYFLTSQKLFSVTKLLFPFDLVRTSEEFTFTEKLVKKCPDLLPAHLTFYSEDSSQYGCMSYRFSSCLETFIGILVPWTANIM